MQKPTREEESTSMVVSRAERNDLEAPELVAAQEQEPFETYDVYLGSGSVVILKREQESTGDQCIESTLTGWDRTVPSPRSTTVPLSPAPTHASPLVGIVVCSLYMLLVLCCLAFQLYVALFPATVTVLIIPKGDTLTATVPVRIVPDIPGPGDIRGRRIPAMTVNQRAWARATGRRHQDATNATGTITLYNGQFSPQFVQAGTIFIGTDGIHIAIDQDAIIPAGNPPIYGQATVPAHAIAAGTSGNIAAFDIHESCCASSVLAKNTSPFTGGLNARDFTVVTQDDINTAARPLENAVLEHMAGGLRSQTRQAEKLLPLPCVPTITADPRMGEEARQVQVTVSATCSAVAYPASALEQKATTLLSVQAEHALGAHYHLFGHVQVTIIRAAVSHTSILLTVRSQGTWVYLISPALKRNLLHTIAGKTLRDALIYLLTLPGIRNASIHGVAEDQKLPTSTGAIHLAISV